MRFAVVSDIHGNLAALEAVVADVRKTLKALEATLDATERTVTRVDSDVTPKAARALTDLSRTLAGVQKSVDGVLAEDAPMQRDVRDTLREISRAAEALRNLADFLERNPGAILRGRGEEPKE